MGDDAKPALVILDMSNDQMKGITYNKAAVISNVAQLAVNDYFQVVIAGDDDASNKIIAMGGVGDFGIILQADDFARGQTGPCRTYNNPPLCPDNVFEIAALEVYGLQPMLWS